MTTRNFHEEFEIERIVEEAKGLRRIVFNKGLASLPGQFVKLWIPGTGERPFSVQNDKPLELTIKNYGGAFTEKVFSLMPGERVFVRGPYGNSFMDHVKEDGKKLLVCGGCGVVPMEFLARKLTEQGHDVRVLLGAKCSDEVPAFFRGMDPVIATDDGSLGYKGLVTEFMDMLSPGGIDQFFICGPEVMMIAASERAERYVSRRDIILSLERYMKCSRGICGSCELDGYRICVDGPVFRYSDLKGGDFGRRKRLKSGKMVRI